MTDPWIPLGNECNKSIEKIWQEYEREHPYNNKKDGKQSDVDDVDDVDDESIDDDDDWLDDALDEVIE